MRSSCGIDFGTSNSAVAVTTQNRTELAHVEAGHGTLPSAIFFDFEEHTNVVGRSAIERYVGGVEGRFMRSLKSILGSSTIHETTQVGSRSLAFSEIIALLLTHLKRSAEAHGGHAIDSVVLGRPVHFVDGDGVADQRAEDTLRRIAELSGFKKIEFQFEPIAASLQYEQSILREQLALIVDIGGGTSDFSVVRVSPERAHLADRSSDVLANEGVHVGGTDFDKFFSLSVVMPLLGLNSKVRDAFGLKVIEAPKGIFSDLATWHRIVFLYDAKTLRLARELQHASLNPELMDRLIKAISERLGHRIALGVEAAKIKLTDDTQAIISLEEIEAGLIATASRAQFEQAIEDHVARIGQAVSATLRKAGIAPDRLDVVFFTGGSSSVPLLRQTIASIVPESKFVDGDLFASVALGLGLDARRRFS